MNADWQWPRDQALIDAHRKEAGWVHFQQRYLAGQLWDVYEGSHPKESSASFACASCRVIYRYWYADVESAEKGLAAHNASGAHVWRSVTLLEQGHRQEQRERRGRARARNRRGL